MLKTYLDKRLFSPDIAVYIVEELGGMAYLAEPLTMKVRDDAASHQPTMWLSIEASQMLMDQLWNCGLRPSEGSGSAGSLAATERHLKDMQSIALGLLKKQGVQI